jgi:perosamine synthetase
MRFRLNEPVCGAAEAEILAEVVKSNMLGVDGQYTTAFEHKFARLHGHDLGLAVQSGTAALHTALKGCSIPHGALVAVPDFTCAATGAAVCMAGGVCAFIDIESETYGMDFDKLKAAHAKQKLWGVILVHLYGVPARDTTAISNWCSANQVVLIEDCSEAHGAITNSGFPVGAMSHAAAFSLRSEKLIGVGEGGIVLTSNKAIYEKAKWFANRAKPRQGWVWKYLTEDIGYNYSLPHLLGAFALVQLDRLAPGIRKRRELAIAYRTRLPSIEWQKITDKSAHWLNVGSFPVDISNVTDVDKLLFSTGMHPRVRKAGEMLMDRGVEIRPGFFPLRRQPAFANGPVDKDVWESDKLTLTSLCFPSHPKLTIADVTEICHEVENVWKETADVQL